ncbi:MAG: hypothetical protein R2873_26300 [Caldilineaceae bacterium]
MALRINSISAAPAHVDDMRRHAVQVTEQDAHRHHHVLGVDGDGAEEKDDGMLG